MISDFDSRCSLPEEARSVIWRIFGNGESPQKEQTTFNLIEPIVRGNVPPTDRERAIAEISGWFQAQGDHKILREDMSETVARLILSGVGDAFSSPSRITGCDTAFWAVGFIETDTSERIISSLWSEETVDEFSHCALDILEKLLDIGRVVNPIHVAGVGIPNARSFMNAEGRKEKFQTIRELEGYDLWLYPGVRNVVGLLVKLNPENFYRLVDRIDHPVIQVCAARYMVDSFSTEDYGRPLEWINGGSSDSMVALATVQILRSVNELDWDFRLRSGYPESPASLDSTASSLLCKLVGRLELMEPVSCVRWIFELLHYSRSALSSHGGNEKPPRVKELEDSCVQLLARLVHQSWSRELLDEFRSGVELNSLSPQVLPLAAVAWEVREDEPERADEIAELILETHETHIGEAMDGKRSLFYRLSNWDDVDRITSLGVALALRPEGIDPARWALERCRELPLSVWDAEENPENFRTADRAARLQFLVALHSIPAVLEINSDFNRATVISLVERLWEHRHFSELHSGGHSDGPEAAEYAARLAIELGEPSDSWILDQVRNPRVDPRSLYGLINQRVSSVAKATNFDTSFEKAFVTELHESMSGRFPNVAGMGLSNLQCLGEIWLLLNASTEAEQTAMAIIRFRKPSHLKRAYDIRALKLLAFAASERRLAPSAQDEIKSLYNQLWPGYTPTEEKEERQVIDEFLKK